jgi:hypothetical protein
LTGAERRIGSPDEIANSFCTAEYSRRPSGKRRLKKAIYRWTIVYVKAEEWQIARVRRRAARKRNETQLSKAF